MTCPRCERAFDVLQFRRMAMVEKYADETTPVYKCPECKWIFAPAEPVTLSTAPFEVPLPSPKEATAV